MTWLRRTALVAGVVVWACQAQSATRTVTLSCAVAYMPARSTWVREVQIEADKQTIRSLRIDGLTPYSFSRNPRGVSTAIDNERIQIDLTQAQWTSDFRGLASGQGRCETVDP